MLPDLPSHSKPGERVVTTIEDKEFYPWGAKVYPSGEFVLWRKQREKAKRQKESLFSAGFWLFRNRMLDKVQEMWGVEAVYLWWAVASELDLQRVRPHPASPVNACPIDGWKNLICDLGSSALNNSEKSRRGLKGLTRYGANLVREAALGLERRYGRAMLSFWTCTLPPLLPDDLRAVCENWSKILENLKKKLLYHLKQAGLPAHIVGVTELQTERFEKEGYPAWHIHWVFVGRHRFQSWAIPPATFDVLWREAVENVCTSQYSFKSASKVEGVRKSVARYLSKYLSKGGAVGAVVEEVGEFAVPFSWFTCTAAVRKWVKVNTLSSLQVAKGVHEFIQSFPGEVAGLWAFCLETRPGCKVAVCWLGRLPDPPPLRVPLA